MQVPDEIRKCVCFLMYRTKAEHKLAGTGVFVAMPIEGVTHKVAVYLVTARHILDAIDKRTVDGKVYLRMNLAGQGGVVLAESQLDKWVRPDDLRIDLAAISVTLPDTLDHRFLAPESFATKEVIAKNSIGIGDEVFVTGLFTQHIGEGRNIPILRIGNISAMPEEPVRTKAGPMEAFLVECRSIGGLSGSPVFVHLGGIRRGGDGGFALKVAGFSLLGIMHGHWNVAYGGHASIAADGVFDDEKLNTGIGVVVPAYAILELLNAPELVKARSDMAELLLKTPAPEGGTIYVGLPGSEPG